MSIPNNTYSPPVVHMSMSGLRRFLEEDSDLTGTLRTECTRCKAPIYFRGKWCIRNNGVQCVPTNEEWCACGYVMTPGELLRNIKSA